MNTLISVAHAGGQGKSTLAEILYLAAKKTGQSHRVVATDHMDESGHSKLGKLYPDVVEEFGVGATLTAARANNNSNAAIQYWDKLGGVLLSGGTVIDVGANVFPNLLDWSVDRHVKKLMDKRNSPPIDFFCICKSERHAIENVESLIQSIVQKDSFKIGRIFVVQNEVGGPFAGNIKRQIGGVAGEHPITYLTLPKCQSEIWQAMEKEGVSIERALAMDEDELVEILGVDLWVSVSGATELKEWFDGVSSEFRDAGVFSSSSSRASQTTVVASTVAKASVAEVEALAS